MIRFGIRGATATSSWFGLVLAVTFAVDAGRARADVELPVLAAPSPRVRVDGWLREWSTQQFATVGIDVAARMRFAFSADANGLYVVASVDDDRMVRSASPSSAEDAIVVTLVGTSDRGPVSADLWLYAGVVDQAAATITVGTVSPRAASIVEMPTRTGYDLEAFVPWSAIPAMRDFVSLRAVAKLHDVDVQGAVPRDVSSSSATSPAAMPRVVGTAGELFALTSFLRAKRASASSIEAEIRANFAGDSAQERIVVVAGSIAVFGSSYANGRDFDYVDLGLPSGGISDLRAVDFDGDGRNELVLVTQLGDSRLTVRELRVYRFPGDRIVPLFRNEISLAATSGRVESTWSIETVDRAQVIVLRSTPVQGNAPSGHAVAPDSRGVLALSSGFVSRTFGADSGGFSVVAEARVPEAATVATPQNTRPTEPVTSSPVVAQPVQPTRTVSPSFDANAILAIARRDRNLAADVPSRFSTTADVAEDARPETIVVLGRTVVLLGPGFRSGRGYLAIDLGVASADLVVGLSAADVTGDGKAEIWARVRQAMGTPAQPFWLELLVLYTVGANGVSPLLTVQIGLGDATRSIRNEARVVGRGRSLQFAIGTGAAVGFDARSFPFQTTATPGMTTLLLPWRDREVRYRWDGHAIVTP